jgi:2-polyprenyl-3-methyl-5-hydroxy-6-metoxy-1,4-benzoquinol methylase
MNTKTTSSELREMFNAFRISRILLTAYELGFFTVIGTGGKTALQISAGVKTNLRATIMLLDALCAIGMLHKKDDLYTNSEISRLYLTKESPQFIGGFMHTVNLWDTWSMLTGVVRDGKSRMKEDINDRSDIWLDSFIEAMHDRAKRQAPKLVANIDLTNVKRVLDVGGGPGTFAMEFVRAKKGITADVFDLPNVITLTKKYIERAGLVRKIGTVIGDYTVDDLGKGYDLIFLSAIVHSNSSDVNALLIKKCADALNPKGSIVIQDHIMDEDRTSPVAGALFAINMLVSTSEGNTYTEAEVIKWFTDAGIRYEKRIDTPFETTQVIGRKEG